MRGRRRGGVGGDDDEEGGQMGEVVQRQEVRPPGVRWAKSCSGRRCGHRESMSSEIGRAHV